jgi:hypothetical protein
MKLKLVVASMSVLGLISSPVFADPADTQAATTTTTTTTTADASAPAAAPAPKHHKHHVKHHHHAQTHRVYHAQQHEHVAQVTQADYKDAGALPAAPVVPVLDTHQMIYNAMSQNVGRSMQASPDWFNRIGVSGGVNFDAHWGNRDRGYEGEDTQRLALNDAYMNVGANVNDWTKAFMSLSFSNPSGKLAGAPLAGQYSNVYLPVGQINLEQAYVTLANYDVAPVFFQIGKQFTDYGRYTIHPIERTLSQVMTESLQTSAKLGFITQMGFHGDVYAFSNPSNQFTAGHSNTVYGGALGFDQLNDQLGFDLGVGYMSDLTGVNDIQAAIGNAYVGTGTYVHTVGGIAVYGDVNSGPFTLSARYTQAIQHFNPNDLSTQYGTPFASGARPWAADVTAGFGYNYWSKNQNIYLGYEASNNAVNLALPRNRWLVGYNIDAWRATNLGLELAHDTAYSSGNGGPGRNSNTIAARASVKFG